MNYFFWELKQTSTLVKSVFIFISTLFLVYLLWPGPKNIAEFASLPNATRSTLSGDTVEVPNIVGYFSSNYREFVVNFFNNNYQKLSLLPFPPIRLNYPPEEAFIFVKDQTQSTFLEEAVYPLRNSLFVNGLEPFYQDGKPRFEGAAKFQEDLYETKTTLRFYPSSAWIRILVWIGINLAVIFMWVISKKILLQK